MTKNVFRRIFVRQLADAYDKINCTTKTIMFEKLNHILISVYVGSGAKVLIVLQNLFPK